MKSITLNADQQAAVRMVQENQISLLFGKPGTGKTTATLAIIEWAESQGMYILQCAPTGKAAKRMQECTGGRPASTIHTALACAFENGEFVFTYNKRNQWPYDLVIIDEASMITTSLMADVLRAVDPAKTKILLVGDPGQLPSIGAGAVLRDLIESKVIPKTELREIQRNSGLIVAACAAIHEGRLFRAEKKIDLEAENPINLIHIECQTPEKILSAIQAVVCERMPLRGFDPTWDVQVLSPVNKRGLLSCAAINLRLQVRLNPDELDEPGDYKFKPGDKVINTKNQNIDDARIVNGDIGKILEINKPSRELLVEFYDPLREVTLEMYDNNLLHAYCITTHRFQGSEAPVIIIPVHTSFSFFVTRKWLYTAVSRAQKICITIGQFVAINQMIQNKNERPRNTRLKQRLQEEMEFAAI